MCAGIANVKAIDGGKADLGFANSISTVDGIAGRAPFSTRRVSYVSYTDAVSPMKDNYAQAFTLGTTVPASSIMDLASSRDIKLVGIPDDKFQARWSSRSRARAPAS